MVVDESPPNIYQYINGMHSLCAVTCHRVSIHYIVCSLQLNHINNWVSVCLSIIILLLPFSSRDVVVRLYTVWILEMLFVWCTHCCTCYIILHTNEYIDEVRQHIKLLWVEGWKSIKHCQHVRPAHCCCAWEFQFLWHSVTLRDVQHYK